MISLTIQWWIQGRGPGGLPPSPPTSPSSPYFWTKATKTVKVQKQNVWEGAPILPSGLDLPLQLFSIMIIIIWWIFFSFLFIDREPTTWPANNCLQISVLLQIIFCSCVIETTLLCENGRSLSWAFKKRFNCWELWKIKLTQSLNDKIIIELDYRKISWFVSVLQINYLPQPSASANNWSARHWQITIFWSTSSILLIVKTSQS